MTQIKIGDEIGRGGFCVVHDAWVVDGEGRAGPILAIKRLQPEVAADEEIRRRFEREARLLDDVLDHPNIA